MKRQKPTKDFSQVSFQYICQECGCSHWLFLREIKTEGFKVVCYCDNIIRPEKVSDIDIIYEKKSKAKKKKIKTPVVTEVCEPPAEQEAEFIESQNEPIVLLEETKKQCMKTLLSFGYSVKEASPILDRAFEDIQENDCAKLIEYSLKNIEV